MKNPRERKDAGVSEVMGTILTLGITVTLFSTVFLMLGNLPEPTGTTYAEFNMTVDRLSDGSVWLNITHNGGEVLMNYSTTIYVITDTTTNTVYAYSLWDGLHKGQWRPGEVWSYHVQESIPIDTSTGYIYIFDTNRNSIIWRENFVSGVSTPLPPIIMDRGTSPSVISTSSTFKIYAYVKDPNDDFYPGAGQGSLTVDLSALHLYSNGNPVGVVSLTHEIGYRFSTPPLNTSSSTPIGSHVAQITATDAAGNTAKDLVSFVIGQESTEDCDIYISEIKFTPQTPVTGETTQITVTFANAGNSYGYCIPHIYDTYPNGTTENLTTGSTVYVAAHGESTRTYTWTRPRPAGIHQIEVYAEIPAGSPTDSDMTNNRANESISVIPKILLVDDDHDEDFNTAAYMMDALNATGYNYDIYRVAYSTDDGPQYSTLQDYDVVIWMTGKDVANSLTVSGSTADIYNLEKFLDGGGKLWLIGENIMNNPFIVSTFMTPYMGVSLAVQDVSLPSLIDGDNTLIHIDNISMASTGYDNGHYTDFISTASVTASRALYDNATLNNIAISNNPGTYSTMFFSFEFSAIKYASDRAQITYETLRWLSGISGKTGRDVSVSGIRMDPEYPLYKDNVNISIYLRNNGWMNETVRVQLIIDMKDVVLSSSVVTMEKNGGINITYGLWDANILGEHTLIARVDPYNEISESDETNNVMIKKFLVRFRTLIVDDDESSNNGGALSDRTDVIIDCFDNLLSERDVDSTYTRTTSRLNVSAGSDGPDYENMSMYNAVIWVTGDATSSTFTAADMDNITKYLSAGGMLWIVGDGFMNDLSGGGFTADELQFLATIGIDGTVAFPDAASGFQHLIGTTDDPISHGIALSMDSTMTIGADSIPPSTGADVIFQDENGNSVGIKYEKGSYKVVTLAFDMGATDGLMTTYSDPHFEIPSDIGNRTRYEMVYLIMHWFGQINSNAELKVGSDLYINGQPIDSMHLVLGESYILEAKIHNVADSNVYYTTVRFYDGDTIIGSTSISSVEDSTATASVIWTPLYAGSARPIRVIVDYHQELEEMPNPSNLSENLFEYNNEAVHYVPVYFFWDDMENGTANWVHLGLVMNINGESPIDYMGSYYAKTYTDILSNWNETLSSGVGKSSDYYHSSPTSYWLMEEMPDETVQTVTGQIPLDIVFVIDTSGSMEEPTSWRRWNHQADPGEKIYEVIQATKEFINDLSSSDRAAIYTFEQTGAGTSELYMEAAFMTPSNKTLFNSALDNIYVGGGTPFYDALGDGIDYLLSPDYQLDSLSTLPPDETCGDNSRLEVVVSLTDGQSNSDTEWSPNADWGDTTTNGGGSSSGYTYKGLQKAPPMVFTIGVDITHSDIWSSNYPVGPDWSHTIVPSDSDGEELWKCADKSAWPWGKYGRDYNTSSLGYSSDPSLPDPDPFFGHFYQVDDSSQIGTVFTEIRHMVQSIATGGQTAPQTNITRASENSLFGSNTGAVDTRASPLPGPKIVETRYMTSNSIVVNGLTADELSTTQSSSTSSYDDYTYHSTFYAGIRVYVRDFAGSETEITTSPVAVASKSYSASSGLYSATWSCPGAALSTTDSIVVKVYIGGSSSPSTLAATFTTPVLGATNLNPSTWTVYYYLRTGRWSGSYHGIFYWGDSSYNSRIEGFDYSSGTPPQINIDKPNGGETLTGGTTYMIYWNTTRTMDDIDHVNLQYSLDGGGTWTDIITNLLVPATGGPGSYLWHVPNPSSTVSTCLVRGYVYDVVGRSSYDDSNSTFTIIPGPTSVLYEYPKSGTTGLPTQYAIVVFEDSMDTSVTPTITQTGGTDPGGWVALGWYSTYETDDTYIWLHNNWTMGDTVTLEVSNFRGAGSSALGGPYSWTFDVIDFSSSTTTTTSTNSNKTAVTPTFDLSQASFATLTFWHKYNIVPSANGAFIEIGYKDPAAIGSDGWAWRYIIPSQGAYTGNLNLDVHREDSFGNTIDWCWNGVSGKGTFDWEYVKVDLLNYVPPAYRSEVRIKFNYTQYGGGTGYGWYIDDVKVVMARAGDSSSNINSNSFDVWQSVTTTGRDGSPTTAWWNGDPTTGFFKGGIDNSLISRPIDLTNAWSAELSADLKFNINNDSGAPPDGFRVEISTDNGITWYAINLGARSAWGVSGNTSSNYWVQIGELSRINVDLSAFRGNVILVRFRVVTSSDPYDHFEDPNAGFGGFYVDNVVISGESLS